MSKDIRKCTNCGSGNVDVTYAGGELQDIECRDCGTVVKPYRPEPECPLGSSKMTLDEAIEHCKEVTKGACGAEHQQLAEWLEELKRYRAGTA